METVLNPLQRILSLVRTEKRNVWYLYVYGVISGIINLSLPLGIQAIVGLVLGGMLSSSWLLLSILVTLGILVAGLTRLAQLSILEVFQRRFFARTAIRFSDQLVNLGLNERINNLVELSEKFFDVITVQKSVSKLLLDFSASLLQIIFGVILLSLYHPIFLAFGIFLISIILMVFRATWNRGIQSSRHESDFKFKTAFWLTQIAAHRTLFSLKAGLNYHNKRTNEYVDGYVKSRKAHFKVVYAQLTIAVILKTLLTAGLLVLGSLLLVREEINLGQFVASEILIILLLDAMEKVILTVENIYDSAIALEKLGKVTDVEDFQDSTLIMGLEQQLPEIKVYSGKNQQPLLHILRGEKICISGRPGSGRTRILKWLSGHSSGDFHVILNDIPIENINKIELGKRVGLCLQNSGLFKGTLLENITLGLPPDDKKLSELLTKLHLEEFIRQQEQGLNYLFNFEKSFPNHIVKKFALARALYHQPSLLLIDDIWGAFDRNELLGITQYIKEQNFTAIIVSNHIPVAAHMDRLIEMKESHFHDHGQCKMGDSGKEFNQFMWS